jgi:hypothetical protein
MPTFNLRGLSPEAKQAFILSLLSDFKEAKRKERISLKLTINKGKKEE